MIIVSPSAPGLCATVLTVAVNDNYLRSPRYATVEDIAEAFVREPHLMTELEGVFIKRIEEEYGTNAPN